jgi:hypothetical protein
MKALKTKGKGWDVFHADGSSDNTDGVSDYYEIQRIDAFEYRGEVLEPAFEDDEEAVRHVVKLAKRGDKQAVNALWAAYLDPVVHQVLWEDVL